MTVLTRSRKSRIRNADADDIGRMANQESYFGEGAVRAILKRIEIINTENSAEAMRACEHAIRLIRQIRSPAQNLKALALAIYGGVARCNGQTDIAIDKYHQALRIPNLTPEGRADVLARLAVAYFITGRKDSSLAAIEEALPLVADPVPVLTVRGWIKMQLGPLDEALGDCLEVMEVCRKAKRYDYSRFSAIINACHILSYASCPADDATVAQVKSEVATFRQALPTGGSTYSKVRRQRLNLARADALLLIRAGEYKKAAYPLKRAALGLVDEYPDDAFDAYIDLVFVLARLGLGEEAVNRAQEAVLLLDRINYTIEPMGRNALLSAAELPSIPFAVAQEIKILLRLRKDKS